MAWRSLRRLGHIARVLALHGLAAAVAGRTRLARRLPGYGLPRPERLRLLFEDLGGTFLKFGQMLALQPDVLPLAYCNALFKLLDRVDPFPWPEVERIVREDLGAAPDALFEEFERVPMATASVGQVHRARLGGARVVVKVQRPDVEFEFAHDVRLMIGVVRLVRLLRVRALYWLIDPVSEFVGWSREEIDSRHEARYLEILGGLAADEPGVRVPHVYRRLCSRRVLVSELLEGPTMLDYLRALESGDPELPDRLAARGFDRRRFAARIVDNFLDDALSHGVYHADLHPANLLILEDDVVGYVDFGITGVMSRYSRRHLLRMSLALARGDVETMYHEYLCITSHDERSDFAAFRTDLAELARGWYEETAEGPRLRGKITWIFRDIFQLSRRRRIMPERDIVKYVRSAIAIDGLLARFDPGVDVGSHIARVCAERLREEAWQRWSRPEEWI
ncbi:MAG TPA: AarF/UbiB family protein, partial [Thermoanaerobaculia bacterium]|nr:AarF/UbiB family protein [Thermoanaerobaculia bacterium]